MNLLTWLIEAGFDIGSLIQAMMQRSVAPSPAEQYPFMPALDYGGGVNMGTTSSPKEGDISGKMTSEERSKMSNMSSIGGMIAEGLRSMGVDIGPVGRVAANQVASGLLNAASVPNPTTIGVRAPTAAIGQFEDIRDILNVPAQRNILGPSATDLQSMVDTFGWGMYGAPGAESGIPGGVSMGPGSAGPGGLAGVGQAPGDTGRNDGTSPGIATGGVRYATRPTRITYGEPSTGGETLIAIPNWMKRPGLQGQEAAIKNALLRALMGLR